MPVYFMQIGGEGGLVKIGRAQDPWVRVKQLQNGNPFELVLRRVLAGGAHVETWLRDRYRHLIVRGEWHRFDADMLSVEPPPEVPVDVIERRLARQRERARERGRRVSKTYKPRAAGLAGLAPETARGYEKVWRAFLAWRGMGESLPVSDEQIIGYLECRRGGVRGWRNALAAISKMHQVLGHDKVTLRPGIKHWVKAHRGWVEPR